MSAATEKCCPTCHQPLPPPHGITIDGRAVLYKGKCYLLTAGEATLFGVLVSRIGRTVRYQTLYDHLYDLTHDNPPEMQIINVMVSKIRKRLVNTGLAIVCEYSLGFRLELPGAKPRPANVEHATAA